VETKAIVNPLGGYVEVSGDADFGTTPPTITVKLRWLNDALDPQSDWQIALSFKAAPGGYGGEREVFVDRLGRALVLLLIEPAGFGAPPPPSTWTLTARWVAPTGPLGDPFKPAAPVDRLYLLFAGWGKMLSLPQGNVALFHNSFGGVVSPAGWYASYNVNQPKMTALPDWLKAHDGSIQVLRGANAYAATQRDPNTCARTALLIAPSGRTCFSLPLENSSVCSSGDDVFWPDGTLVVEDKSNIYQVRWWPGLARLAR
jgi:hypothetical protein